MENRFVSRAGEKLAFALENFKIDVGKKICADLGCSTGGFTDCLLQNGAAKIYAVDTGYGVLDWKLRNNPKVVVMERSNALHLTLPEKVDLVTIDVGWTPQKLIIPKALGLLGPSGDIISLIKPQYEATDKQRRGGLVKEEYLKETLDQVLAEIRDLPVDVKGIVTSPLKGTKGGNTEFLVWLKK